MSNNENLIKARKVKNDEYYTRIEDIENEINNYQDYLKGKRILMPCDDPELIPSLNGYERNEQKASQFWVYFHMNFERLGLKEIVSTHYSSTNKTYGIRYSGGEDSNIYQYERFELEQNGDFRSPEVTKLMQQSDIIITNPPFSLFREFTKWLIDAEKKFIIIAPIEGSVTYKDFFSYIMNGIVWTGYTRVKEFLTIKNGEHVYEKFGNIGWWTNIETLTRSTDLHLYKKYNPTDYPKYDDYNAIEVSKVKAIPYDYYGEMGVPVSFISDYNPNQFEILGLDINMPSRETKKRFLLNGRRKYARLIIKRKDK